MKFTDIDKAIMIGLLLGDGCIGSNCKISISHSIKQYDYCVYKAKLLHSVVGGKDIKVHENINTYTYKNGDFAEKREALICRFTKTSKSFQIFRDMLYPNGHKEISNTVLNCLNETSLALWGLDDGNLDCHKSGNGSICYSLRGSLYCSLEEAELVVNYFKTKGNIVGNIRTDTRSPGKYGISCGKKEGNKFLNLIRDIVRTNVPSMSYKVRDI